MFQLYFDAIKKSYNTNQSLEHTYRTALENLMNEFINKEIKKEFSVIHEPKRETFGAPDFKIIDKFNNVIGYIECKDISVNLRAELKTKQLEKYLSISNNLILTNYIDFILLKNKKIYKECSIADISELKKSKILISNEKSIVEILSQFFLSKPDEIKDAKKLSEELANRTKILKDIILEQLEKDTENPFSKFYQIFKSTIINDLQIKSFADMYAQIIGIGLLFLRLSKNEKLTKDNVLSKIPKYIPLLKDFFPNASFDEWDKEIIWILDDIIYIINCIDIRFIKETLSYKTMSIIEKRDINLSDPFIHFYELFLTVYDKKLKKDKGVFYTPESVVSFIVRSIDLILRKNLKIKDGFIDNKIKVLDFASGTGTFILALIDYIKIRLIESGRKTLFDSEIREHILEDVYGFEILVVPYIISHLRIHEYLESNNFIYRDDKKERAEIYLTNTLSNKKAGQTLFLKNIDEEAALAQKIKNNEEIMVIMGNPPYSNFSQNKSKDDNGNLTWIGERIQEYKPAGEKKLNLDDDYIKFIRFACWKLENIEKGVIGIITNNSFLNGITHRKMRKILINSFDEIYILNLHGNGNIAEICADGSADNNVFDIKDAGVCIIFLIKKDNKKNKKAKLFYSDLYGKQKDKYNFLYDNNINTVKFAEINYTKFNNEFLNTQWGKTIADVGKTKIKLFGDGLNFFIPNQSTELIRQYGSFWGIKEIFKEVGSSIKTDRDELLIDFKVNDLKKKMFEAISGNYNKTFKEKYSIKNSSSYKFEDKLKSEKFNECNIIDIDYRPFDKRKIYYNKNFTSRAAYEIMRHFIGLENIGLIFKRQFKSNNNFTYAFVTDKITESCLFESAYANNSCAPLYIYSDTRQPDLFQNGKNDRYVNFKTEFVEFIENLYQPKPKSIEIFYYIYAILYSNNYRVKYNELLKIDFPRVPFLKDLSLFKKIAALGERLSNLHLLKENPVKKIARFGCNNPDYQISKIEYKNNKIWINESTSFDNISESIWNYCIGGYQVLKSWLDYRKNTDYKITNEDLKHFMNIIDVLNETILLQNKIDKQIEGWL